MNNCLKAPASVKTSSLIKLQIYRVRHRLGIQVIPLQRPIKARIIRCQMKSKNRRETESFFELEEGFTMAQMTAVLTG